LTLYDVYGADNRIRVDTISQLHAMKVYIEKEQNFDVKSLEKMEGLEFWNKYRHGDEVITIVNPKSGIVKEYQVAYQARRYDIDSLEVFYTDSNF